MMGPSPGGLYNKYIIQIQVIIKVIFFNLVDLDFLILLVDVSISLFYHYHPDRK
jgi:hypothetical protein